MVVRAVSWAAADSGAAASAAALPASRLARMRSGVDLQALEAGAQPRRGRAGGDQQLAQRPPLGVPGAGRALVLLLHRGEQRRDEPGRLARAASAETAATGLRLCGIAEEPPGAASRTSPTSVCASSVDVARRLRDTPAGRAERAGQRPRSGVRSVCHGSTGSASPSSAA